MIQLQTTWQFLRIFFIKLKFLLMLASSFYYWDGSGAGNYPAHDPCGDSNLNQLTGVPNPYGAVYLRGTRC